MWRLAGTFGAVGLEIAVAIAIGYFGGRWLDRRLGTAPWLGYVGFAAGIGAAVKALVRVTRQYKRMTESNDKQPAKDQPTKP